MGITVKINVPSYLGDKILRKLNITVEMVRSTFLGSDPIPIPFFQIRSNPDTHQYLYRSDTADTVADTITNTVNDTKINRSII